MNLKCGISSDSTSVVILNELLLFYFVRSKAYRYYSSVPWPQQSSPEHDLCKMRMETAMGKSQYNFAVPLVVHMKPLFYSKIRLSV